MNLMLADEFDWQSYGQNALFHIPEQIYQQVMMCCNLKIHSENSVSCFINTSQVLHLFC